MNTNLPTIAQIIAATNCPACKAQAGARCTSPKGMEVQVHRGRIVRANRAAARKA